MKFHVSQLLKEAVGTIRDYDIYENLDTIGDMPLAAPVTGHVRLMRTNRGVLVRGNLSTRVILECSRCLTEFEMPIDIHLNDQFWQKIDIYTGRVMPLPEGEDHDMEISEDHILDITEAVRQYLVIGLPMQALCTEACKGMCPNCGANLNDGACRCTATNGSVKREAADMRLAALARWFDSNEPTEEQK